MASAESLVAMFEAITKNIERDRADLNQLDRDDGDSGDNMVDNFQLVTKTLRKTIGKGNSGDIGLALGQAAQVLRDNGKGATAPIYAAGFDDASTKLAGKSSFQIDDLLPLLEGLLGGMQRANTTKPGEGSMLDSIVPGVMGYIEGKRNGQSEMEAILGALLNVRRGANGTSRAASGYGRGASRDTTGEIDPGAAGAASMLEGMFGALLQSAMRGQGRSAASAPAQQQAPQRQAGPESMILDVLGSLFSNRT